MESGGKKGRQRNLKICFLLGSYPKDWVGGAEVQSFMIARELFRKGHQVYYLAVNTLFDKPFYEVDEGIEVYRVRKTRNVWRYYRKVLAIFWKIAPDLCYNRSLSELPLAFILCRLTHTPLVYAIASDDNCLRKPFPYKIWRPRACRHQWNYWLSQALMKKADAVLSQSGYQSQLLDKNFETESRVVKKWMPVPDELELTERNGAPIVLWLANIKDVKRPELFVSLAAECSQLGAEFVMAGHLSDNVRFRDVFRRASTLPNFRYLGGVSLTEAEELMKKASLFVSTSAYEGFPSNTFIQAWLRRVPTVSLSVDPEGILNKENIGFCSGSFDRMVQDVKLLLGNEDLRRAMGAKAREYVLREHCNKRIILQYEDIFKAMARNP
jgi:glycosyltransferase involved in cell wall biosynthesis